MNKVVIIIEDKIKDFERIKAIIESSFDSSFVCRQNYTKTSFNNFCEDLRNSLVVNHGNPSSQKIMKEELMNELRNYCGIDEEPVYLIDYLLNEEDDNINGINFCKKILKELYPNKYVPVMFISNAKGNDRLSIDEYCSIINDNTICDVVIKPDVIRGKWNVTTYFINRINNFIKQAHTTSIPKMTIDGEEKQNMIIKKKIFISYSRKDVDFKNELRNHLNILSQVDITDNWSCDDIHIGNWDDQIQKELDDSNLIIYMLSANFFSSSYILEKEVQNVIDGKRERKSILCVIVSDFIDLDKIENYLQNWQISDKQKAILMLKDFQYLPYGKEFNQITKQNEEKLKSLKKFSNDGDIETALKQISEKVLNILKI